MKVVQVALGLLRALSLSLVGLGTVAGPMSCFPKMYQDRYTEREYVRVTCSITQFNIER